MRLYGGDVVLIAEAGITLTCGACGYQGFLLQLRSRRRAWRLFGRIIRRAWPGDVRAECAACGWTMIRRPGTFRARPMPDEDFSL